MEEISPDSAELVNPSVRERLGRVIGAIVSPFRRPPKIKTQADYIRERFNLPKHTAIVYSAEGEVYHAFLPPWNEEQSSTIE